MPTMSKVRSLAAADLGIQLGATTSGDQGAQVQEMDANDPILATVRSLLDDNYAGVIFVGPPGTGKSWYAHQVALHLTGGAGEQLKSVQFHPSYQYEDFMESYAPVKEGGFVLKDRHFLDLCAIAERDRSKTCVLVIDELSRADAVRVFGEALTYLEVTKRDQPFLLASGRQVRIPPNIKVLATMNPWDRGVDEVDLALERRFAKIAMEPDPVVLRATLIDNKMDGGLIDRVLEFFNVLRNHDNPTCRIGHAYFQQVKDIESLSRLWRYQLSFHFEKSFRLDPDGLKILEAQWKKVLETPAAQAAQAAPVAAAATNP